jgi:hypothetical protein
MSIEKLDFNVAIQENKHFTTNLNDVIQNIPDAFVLGVYVFLSSLPPTWNINRQHLAKHFNVGRKKIDNALKLLNDIHLIKYVRPRNADGTLGCVTLVVKDGRDFVRFSLKKEAHNSTQPEKGGVVNSIISTTPPEIHSVDKPLSGKRATIKTIGFKDTIKKKKTNRRKTVKSVDNSAESLNRKLRSDMEKGRVNAKFEGSLDEFFSPSQKVVLSEDYPLLAL